MNSLEGQFLVAMPDMVDETFAQTVIYVVGHSKEGAMGLVVNQSHGQVRFGDIIDELKLGGDDDIIQISPRVRSREVLRGGPVETSRGFVLHSADFHSGNTYTVGNEVCLTATLDVLKSMAFGATPSASLLALGCCGWAAGQLEGEILRNGWLTVPYSHEVLFDLPTDKRYDAALAQLHITRASLSTSAGHA